ncbi:MAG: DUF5989 family protein [Gemmataceae bacterium]|nr:DUF5989 family protein [Planctomycetota bacterium]RLT18948.1 MAG: hypothetical protein DWI28_03620 [Planctomycetota bacterium]
MKSDFESQAQTQAEIGFFRELLGFMINNKKWWLLPILVTLGLVGVLILLSTTAAAPFIYTLF